MANGNNETRATALLLSFSAVVVVLLARAVLLQPPGRRPGGAALADLALAAADRFLDGRGLLDLATRRNMVLLCHAILLVILRDAGLLGAPARRRAAATESTASAVVADAADGAGAAEGASCAPVLADAAEPAERTVVVWRRPRGGAKQDAHHHDDGSGRRPVRRRQPRRSAAQQHPAAAVAPIRFAAPAMAEQPEQHQPPMLSNAIVLVEEVPRNYLLLDDLDRAAAAVVELDLPTATDGKKSDFDQRIVVAGDERDVVGTAAEETTPELADDRRIEEFIIKQRRKMRQEMQLERSSWSQQAITAC